ncbi:MAG: hypothetical protein M3Y57_15615, partial [Acidobacteriota bacterium]|nr:hypothetical protein [Acidobacteriota bacterium]
QPDHHGAYLPQNGAQNQALAGMCNGHLHSLAPYPPPTFGRTPESGTKSGVTQPPRETVGYSF